MEPSAIFWDYFVPRNGGHGCGMEANSPAALAPCGHPVAMGEPFSAPKNLTECVLGRQPCPSVWGGGFLGGCLRTLWPGRAVPVDPHAGPMLSVSNDLLATAIFTATSLSLGMMEIAQGFFFFFPCQKKAGWMGSDSFVRKVWKLVAESKSGGVWGDEQGTGYKAVVMRFSMLCSAYSSN